MCKEGRNSLVDQVLIGACHMQTYRNKKACSHMNLRAHTRNEARSPEKHAFLDSSHDRAASVSRMPRTYRVWASMEHESLCCYFQIEVVRTHSVV